MTRQSPLSTAAPDQPIFRGLARCARRAAHTASRLTALATLGLGLTAAAPAAFAQGYALISSEKDNALTVLDLKTRAVTGTIPTCERPRHMQRTADGQQLIVACGDAGLADVIDLKQRKRVRQFELGEDAELFDISPDGQTLYVSNEEDGVVSIIDMANGRHAGEIAVGKEPEGVKLSADGKTLYVTSEAASLVHVIDTASRKVVKNIRVGKRPRRFALTPDGRQLWVTSELDASVSVIDTATYAVVDTIRFEVRGARQTDITPVGILMTRDGQRAYVGLGKANHVAFVDVASRKVTDLVLVGKRAWGLGLDRAEATLYVVNGLSDDLSIVDTRAAKALKTVRVGRVPHSVVVVE
jgi:PQQ-dependent catabolism-associated beta-propeller protein